MHNVPLRQRQERKEHLINIIALNVLVVLTFIFGIPICLGCLLKLLSCTFHFEFFLPYLYSPITLSFLPLYPSLSATLTNFILSSTEQMKSRQRSVCCSWHGGGVGCIMHVVQLQMVHRQAQLSLHSLSFLHTHTHTHTHTQIDTHHHERIYAFSQTAIYQRPEAKVCAANGCSCPIATCNNNTEYAKGG